ncbi:MAG: hypothetical protein ACI4PO_03180 [Faecousia sp.]
MLHPDISMSGFDLRLWHRSYDGQITLVRGARRDVADGSGSVVGFYEYGSQGEFRIVTWDAGASVRAVEDGWIVFHGRTILAELHRAPKPARARFGRNMEVRFLTKIHEEAEPSLYPFLLAIPLLGFCWGNHCSVGGDWKIGVCSFQTLQL